MIEKGKCFFCRTPFPLPVDPSVTCTIGAREGMSCSDQSHLRGFNVFIHFVTEAQKEGLEISGACIFLAGNSRAKSRFKRWMAI